MSDFSKFNKTLTAQEQSAMNKVRNNIIGGGSQNKPDYPEPVSGIYIAQIDHLGIVPHKKTGVPCFDLTMKLIQGMDEETETFLNNWPGRGTPKIFRKLPLVGTKNDGACIGSAIGMASRLHEDINIDYKNDFDMLAADIKNLRQMIDDTYAYLIAYDPSDFNRIIIQEILRSNADEPEPVLSEAVPETAQPVTNYMPQFDNDGFIPMDDEEEYFLPQGIQKPTSYPFPEPDSSFAPEVTMDELANFNEDDELPF